MDTSRLNKIYNCIPPSHVVADIGCDHGSLIAMLISSGRAQKVIATDISAKSLAKAVRLCESHGILDRVDLRQGDGLSVLSTGEAELIVIAGMGGNLISAILQKNPQTAQRANLVLCAHTHEDVLRKFLFNNGYYSTQETLALEDGRYYQIICAVYDGQPHPAPDDFFYSIGEKLLQSRDGLLIGYLEYRLRLACGIIKNAGQSSGARAAREAGKMSAFAQRLEEWIKCLQV